METPLQPLIILPDWKSDSSPAGLSYWDTFQTGCPQRRKYDQQYKELLLELALEDTSPQAIHIGSAFHKILEHYYKDTLAQVAFDAETSANLREALRLFYEYRKRFPREEFTRVVGSEVEFTVPEELALRYFGVPCFTGRVDLVVQVEAEALARLNDFAGRNLSLTREGIYLVDHKTMKAKKPPATWHNSFQFQAYQLGWNLLAAMRGETDRECHGMIANCVVRHVTLNAGSFSSTMVPFPTPGQIAALKAHLTRSYEIFLRDGDSFRNRGTCFNWNQTCPHFTSGACDRS